MRGTYCILYRRVVMDAVSYVNKMLEKILVTADQEKIAMI